jgi:hypothetical protein
MRTSDGNFSLSVHVHGRAVTEYRHESGEMFVEGRAGSGYELRVTNMTRLKVLAVVSVDGLSVMDGKTASRNSSGYILEPFGHADIPGWRLDDNAVAAFGFGELPKAYAAKMGKGGNVGVIGVQFIPERHFNPVVVQPIDPNIVYRGRGSSSGITSTATYKGGITFGSESFGLGGSDEVASAAVYSASLSPSIGTVFGDKEQHHVNRETFVRETDLNGDPVVAGSIVLRYDTANGLAKRGIVVEKPHATGDRVIDANPFPGDAPTGATPPPGWKG